MGRKPLALKRQGKPITPMLEAADPTGGVERQPESLNPLSEIASLKPEKGNLHLETIDSKLKTQTNSADLSSVSKAKKHDALCIVRRSQRIQNASPSQDKEIERIIESITLSEGEKDEVPLDHDHHEDEELPDPIHTQNLDEKVDYALQQLEDQRKAIEELKFMVSRDSSSTGIPKGADVRYKNLYFESQKKIEALTNENHQLALKMERALGKLEAYENGACAFSEAVKKMKEMVLVTNFTRSTETALNFSTQAFPSMDVGVVAKTSPKRKKSRTGKQGSI